MKPLGVADVQVPLRSFQGPCACLEEIARPSGQFHGLVIKGARIYYRTLGRLGRPRKFAKVMGAWGTTMLFWGMWPNFSSFIMITSCCRFVLIYSND
ncbi:hypothetical protein RSAG8_10077, partial [Rhizoctonia solani AG-8 WAC10335]